MKLRISGKNIILSSTLALALVLGGSIAFFTGNGSLTAEIETYANQLSAHDLELQRQLNDIQHGQDVNQANARGYTPLMNAAYNANLKAVDLLLIKGARLHHKAPDGQTALDLAACGEIRQLLQACLLAEGHPGEQEKEAMRRSLRAAHINPDDLTQALFDAVQSWGGNSLELTAKVLALGGNANAVNQGGKHILQVTHRDAGSVVLLLRQGARPNAALDNQGGCLPLLQNINKSNRTVQNLLTAGAQVKGSLALAKAAGKGNVRLTEQLLERGAEANGLAQNGKTVLEHAVQGLARPKTADEVAGIPQCVRLLLEHGARTEYQPENGKPRSPISPGGMSIMPECLRLLVDAGADVNALNSRGANYAQITAYKKATAENLKLLRHIIRAGGNLQHVDSMGETFLFYALPGICGLPVNDPVESIRQEALEVLAGYFDIIKKANPDPAARDRNGNTALHLAVIRRGTADDRVVKFLLNMGVDPAVRNKFGRTALEAMLRNPCGPRSKYVARLLTQKGPMPTDPGMQLVLAAMTDDTATIRQLLKTKFSNEVLATALGCVQNATAADLLLQAGAPQYHDNMAYMVHYGNPDVVRIFVEHQKQQALAAHWSSVRTAAMAKAFVEAGLFPESPADIANERVLAYLLTLPPFNTNATGITLTDTQDAMPMLPYMVAKGRPKMTRLLLEHGVALNGYMQAPMALVSDAAIAEMLIEHGSDLTWRAASGDTLLSLHKTRLRQLAKGYQESPSEDELEAFREHLAIVKLLETAGISDIHPRKEEIKKALQCGSEAETFKTEEFVTSKWSGPVRISEEALVMARATGNDDAANILSLGPDRIKFHWDRGGYGYAVRKADGKFHVTFDEDRYRDFKKAPTQVPHLVLDFTAEDGRSQPLYLHPDGQFAVRGDTGTAGQVKTFKRGSAGELRIAWEKGGETRFLLVNGAVRILNAETAKTVLRNDQPTIDYKEIQVVGDFWEDTVRISTEFMVAARTSHNRDSATVVQISDSRLTLNWDRWDSESFTRQEDGKYHKINREKEEGERIRKEMRDGNPLIRVKSFPFLAPGWEDTVLISFAHKVAMRESGSKETATVVDYNADQITLKWDTGKQQCFTRQPNGTYRAAE